MRVSSEQREAMLSLIEQWQQSGLSQKAFYEQHKIPAHVFYYWYKRYRKQRAGLDQPATSNGFVQLQPLPEPLAGNIELQLTNGNRIIFHQPVSADYLKALIF
jgi:transposase-like protein